MDGMRSKEVANMIGNLCGITMGYDLSLLEIRVRSCNPCGVLRERSGSGSGSAWVANLEEFCLLYRKG